MAHFGSALESQKDLGFADTDIDDVRRLISDTSVYLLTVTLLASVLHLLFEFLAFKSDVAFWKNNKSLRGLSVRTLFIDLIFQVVKRSFRRPRRVHVPQSFHPPKEGLVPSPFVSRPTPVVPWSHLPLPSHGG
jgi:hypothetical protein